VEGAEAFKAKNAEKARKQFEAFALQVFIGSMLPQENNKMFGTGSAGKLWQSLMAEKLADQITSSGRLRLLPDNATATAPATAASAPAAAPVEARKTEPSGKAR
jgi:Rod binding domain-containing protein